ncbi:ispH [Symbiodinium sp. CCMP2456]|nr:ispH [Symbiodinium sp. CCMP2456]
MASRSTLRFLLAALPVFEASELCHAGDAACAARSSALLQHGARQSRADDESLYADESLYGAGMAPICKDAADFLPEREMWAYCDFYGHGAVLPDETTCNDQEGCYGGTGWCHCEGREGCLAVGGYWFAQTCTMEVEMFSQEQREMLHMADSTGSCLDLEANGMKAADIVSWPATKCCASFPATICDKDLTPQTPCMHDEDFEHNKSMWAWCDTYEAAPSEHECNSKGCEGNEWHCHCETKEGCLAVGGRWEEYQCWQDLQYMSTEVHKGISIAKSQHSCDDIAVWHSPLEYSVDWLGSSCCSSGQSVCQALGGGGHSHHHHTAAGR